MKQFNNIIMLAMLALFSSNKAFAYDFEENGFHFNILSIGDLTCEVTKTQKEGNVVIPSEAHYQGRTLKVIRIGDKAFYECSNITSLSIEEGVEEIGVQSFGFCNGITRIVVPNSLKIVGTGAFAGCKNVERIEIKSLESWCQIDYGGTFFIDDNNKYRVAEYASPMAACSDKANLYLNDQLITEVEIPASISEIKAKTFFNLRQIQRVNLHPNVTKIGFQAFFECKNMETINLPSSIVSIDAQAFYNCISLEAIELHDGLEKLGVRTFEKCSSLKEVVIPSTINELPEYVFNKCYLDKVVLSPSESPISLGSGSLSYTSLIEIHRPFSLTTLSRFVFQDVKGIIIGKEISSIPNGSFSGVNPISLKFNDCGSPLDVGYSHKENVGYADLFVPLFGNEIENLYLGRVLNRNYPAYSIDNDLFGRCFSFKSITIGNQLENDDISFLRFSKYKDLEDLTIGEKISSIPDMSSCDKLNKIVVYGANPPTAIGFANKTFLDCQLYVPYGCKEKYMNADVWKNFWNISEMDYIPPVVPITVTVKGYTRPYGDENPEFEYTVEGGELKGAPAITCSATKESPVGEYAIEIAAGTVENTNVTYVNGTLTVEKAPLTVKAGDYTMKQGDPMPEFAAIFDGFKNDETSEVLTKQPVLTTEATSSSAPGEYAVKVFSAEAQNYEISYVEGKLTITEADPITVTVKSYTRLYGDDNPEFEYTVEGGELKGAPAIICSATKESPVGEYAIEITAGTVENFNVTYVNGTLTVEKAPLTVKAGDYTMKQGEPMPEFAATFEGFKNDETSEVLTKQPVLTTEATSSSAPGEYAVKVSGAEAQNYEISYVEGKLTITEAAPITVTVKSYTRLYGDDNPEFEYTVEGGELKGAPAIICSATKESPVGEYPIEIAAGTVENFNVTYVNGTLTVEKAPLTVKAGDYTMKQGDPMPEFAAIFDGFKNDETSEVLTKQPVLTTEATSSSAPGEYAVKVSGAEAQNYEISYVEGKLTITEAAPITVTVKSYTRLYGDDNPEFEYTVEGGELKGAPAIICSATKESPVGEYPIEIAAGTVENFNVTYVNGILTVEKAPLLVIANDCQRVQFEENPIFTLRYEGFLNGDTEDVLSVKPTASTSATVDSEAGEYEIVVSGGEAENYELSYQSGTLTVYPYSGIAGVTFEHPVNVYSIQGVPVRLQTTSLYGLPRGVYIVERRKVTVK